MTHDTYTCDVHNVPMIATRSGLQHVCPTYDCDQHVTGFGPRQEDMPVTKSENKDETRKKLIEEAAAKKKASTVTIAPAKAKKKSEPEQGADDELDDAVKPKEKPKADPNELTVSAIAAELKVDPKRARARLRAAGKKAQDGRWPTVTRGSKAHKELVAIINPPDESSDDDDDGDDDGDDE